MKNGFWDRRPVLVVLYREDEGVASGFWGRCLILMLSSFLILSFSAFLEASSPEIYSVTPNTGSTAIPTQITIEGAGFAPEPQVSLYGSGPYIAGSCATGDALNVHVSGSYAYVATGSSGLLQVIDITNPHNPSIVGSCPTPGGVRGVYINGSYAYVAAGDSGLQVINIFKPLTGVTCTDANTVTATVPAGYRPGTYILYLTNPGGEHMVIHHAFTIIASIHVSLSAGLNILGCPADIPSEYTSYDLILDLGGEDEIGRIQRYDPDQGTYETTTYDPNGVPCGNEFEIVRGEGYLVYLKKDKSVPFSGPAINPPISCKKGLSIISIPDPPNGYTSYDLLSYLGSPDEITGLKRFNREKGTFETTTYCYGQPSGARFDIVRGEAYLIQMKVARDKDMP